MRTRFNAIEYYRDGEISGKAQALALFNEAKTTFEELGVKRLKKN